MKKNLISILGVTVLAVGVCKLVHKKKAKF